MELKSFMIIYSGVNLYCLQMDEFNWTMGAYIYIKAQM